MYSTVDSGLTITESKNAKKRRHSQTSFQLLCVAIPPSVIDTASTVHGRVCETVWCPSACQGRVYVRLSVASVDRRSQCYFHSEKKFYFNSNSIFFPIISLQFLISISQKILILILIPFFDCNSYFNS